jgi:hypothetical protein
MKEILVLGTAAILGVGFWIHNPFGATNVYPMTADQAYEKLRAVEVEPSGTGPFGRLDVSTTGTRAKEVVWHATGSHANIECKAMIEPKTEQSAWLNVSCGGGSASNGAAASFATGLTRKAVIELVDSTRTAGPPIRSITTISTKPPARRSRWTAKCAR